MQQIMKSLCFTRNSRDFGATIHIRDSAVLLCRTCTLHTFSKQLAPLVEYPTTQSIILALMRAHIHAVHENKHTEITVKVTEGWRVVGKCIPSVYLAVAF